MNDLYGAFDTESHRKAEAYLGYALAQGEGVIVITGEANTGKTQLLAHSLEIADRARLDVVKVDAAALDGDSLLSTVAAGLYGGVRGSPRDQLEAVERALRAASRGGRRTLLIVDDAHAAPLKVLQEVRALSELQADQAALLQVALVGRPDLRDRLQNAPDLERLRQRVIAMHHLDTVYTAQARPADDAPALIASLPTRETHVRKPVAVAPPSRRDNFAELERLLALLERRLAQSAPEPRPDPALERRIAELEQRVEEQQDALRRMLMLLVRWVEARGECVHRPARAAVGRAPPERLLSRLISTGGVTTATGAAAACSGRSTPVERPPHVHASRQAASRASRPQAPGPERRRRPARAAGR